MELSSFAKNVRALRNSRDLTQEELAFSLGVQPLTVGLWETKGKLPRSNAKVEEICKFFDCTEQDLFGYGDGFFSKQSHLCDLGLGTVHSYTPAKHSPSSMGEGKCIDGKELLHLVNPTVLKSYPSGFFIQVEDDYVNKVIPEGAFAFVAPMEVPPGDLAAVRISKSKVVVGSVKSFDDLIVLEPLSFNKSLTRKVFDKRDLGNSDVCILGKVLWFDGEVSK